MSVATLHERRKPTRALDCLLLTFLDAGPQHRKARTKFMEKQVRRVVTNHEADGKAVVLLDGAPGTITERPESGVKSWLLWVTDSVPADVSGSQDRADRKISIPPPPGGSVFRIVDLLSDGETARRSHGSHHGSRPLVERMAAAPSRHAPNAQRRLCDRPVRRDRHAP